MAKTTWYDYLNQAWTVDGVYVRCGHSECRRKMDTQNPDLQKTACFGSLHEGERPSAGVRERYETCEARNYDCCEGRVAAPDNCLVRGRNFTHDAFGRGWNDSRSLEDCHSDADPGL